MPKFSLERRIPACFVSKDLLSGIEAYLKTEMSVKLGESLGDDIDYKVSIKEGIATETLAGVTDYTPNKFSDGTKEIELRWSNGYRAATRLEISIDFDREYFLSKLKVECTEPMARETAKGVADAILRLLDSHRTQNWFFNPFKFPVTAILAAPLALGLLMFAILRFAGNREQSFYLLSGAAFMGWIYFSAQYFRPFISFDTRRQQLFDRAWRWFSLGILGFIVFGTLLPFLRKVLVGF